MSQDAYLASLLKNLPSPLVNYSLSKPYDRPVFFSSHCMDCRNFTQMPVVGYNSLETMQYKVCLECHHLEAR